MSHEAIRWLNAVEGSVLGWIWIAFCLIRMDTLASRVVALAWTPIAWVVAVASWTAVEENLEYNHTAPYMTAALTLVIVAILWNLCLTLLRRTNADHR